MITASRREFLQQSLTLAASAALAGPIGERALSAAEGVGPRIRFGLCTYMWGAEWDLPTLLANCRQAGVLGVELRVQHKHGVDPKLNHRQRAEVKKRFADSPVAFVGLGTNQCYDSPDPQKLKRQIEGTKAFLQLSHDCGSSGVKVKPNDFHDGVPREKTIEQIGKSLNIVGRMAGDLGQQIRLEIHGTCCALPVIKQIMDIADDRNVALCWNCNPEDLGGHGLEYNFNLVKDRLGPTTHVHRKIGGTVYPVEQFVSLLVKARYTGWLLLEDSKLPKDAVAALRGEKAFFEGAVATAMKGRA